MNKKALTLLLPIIFVILAGGIYYQFFYSQQSTDQDQEDSMQISSGQEPSEEEEPKFLIVDGSLQKIEGNLIYLEVTENDEVTVEVFEVAEGAVFKELIFVETPTIPMTLEQERDITISDLQAGHSVSIVFETGEESKKIASIVKLVTVHTNPE